MHAAPTDRRSAVILGLATAVIMLAVSFGAPISDDQKGALLGFTGAVLALLQAFGARWLTTDNSVVVATAQGRQAVAADASVYPNGTPLATAPADVLPEQAAGLLSGTLRPSDVMDG